MCVAIVLLMESSRAVSSKAPVTADIIRAPSSAGILNMRGDPEVPRNAGGGLQPNPGVGGTSRRGRQQGAPL